MSEIRLTVDYSPEWTQLVQNLSSFGKGKIHSVIRGLLADIGKGIVKEIKTVGFSGRPYLISRTGRLKESFNYRVEGATVEKSQISIYSTSPYVRAHTTAPGLTIFPRTAKALALPLSSVLGSRGEKLYPSPLGTNTFKVVVRGGRGFLAFREGSQKNVLSHVLRDSVFIPQRLPVGDFVNSYMDRVGVGLIEERFARAIEGT